MFGLIWLCISNLNFEFKLEIKFALVNLIENKIKKEMKRGIPALGPNVLQTAHFF